jgi:hypothetical protein
MTKDIQRAILKACARFIGKKIEPVEKRLTEVEKTAEGLVCKDAIAELRTTLEQRVATVEQVKAVAGPKGDPGQDAEPVLVADVVRELIDTDVLAPILDLMVADAVAKHFEANPVRDGEQGPQGVPGEKGEPGRDGADGVGLSDALIDRDGALVLTMTDGRAKALGVVVGRDGAPGADGRDGLGMAEVAREYDAETHEIVERWTVAGDAKELRYPAGGIRPGGFYREGMKCHALQAITHDGALWIAKRDTTAKPCLENADDWQLAARKGRDGRDGKDGKPPPGPVKLDGSND